MINVQYKRSISDTTTHNILVGINTFMQSKMTNLIIIIILAVYLSSASGFEIDKHAEDQVVKEGRVITLFCHVYTNALDVINNHNWKKCRWSRHSDGATCLYTYNQTDSSDKNSWGIDEFCDPLIETTDFFGAGDPNKENRLCGIHVPSADRLDNGNWTCALEECKKGISGGCKDPSGNDYTVEATINVKVIIELMTNILLLTKI